MKKIIFIQHEPLTPNIENKYCLKELLSAGFKLEYWDISQIIYPGLKVADEYNVDYLKKITNFPELEQEWKKLSKDCIAIPEFFFIWKTKKIWQLICHSGIPTVKFERYANSSIQRRNFLQKIKYNITPKRITNFLVRQILKIEKRVLDLYQYNYILTSDSVVKNTQRVNHPDYDDYLLHKNDVPLLPYKYICFIDTGYGIHPDHVYYEKDLSRDNELWQKKLNIFFDFLEKKYGIPVVIASHPKIDYPAIAFAGREKIKYKTLNLVLNSEFVIQDVSNSISFSVIANKKIELITTNEMYKSEKSYLTTLAHRLKIPLFNIDTENFETFEPCEIEESARKSYLYSFLTSKETENTLSSEILINFLKTL